MLLIGVLLLQQVSQADPRIKVWEAQQRGDEVALRGLTTGSKIDFGYNEYEAYDGLVYGRPGRRIAGQSVDVEKHRRLIRIMKEAGYPFFNPKNQTGVADRLFDQAGPLVRVWLEEGESVNRFTARRKPLIHVLEAEDHWYKYFNQKREPRSAFYFESTPVFAEFTHPNDPATPQGAPPLNAAAFYGRTAIMEILKRRGAKLEGTNDRKETALHAACMRNTDVNAAAVRLLLKWGANRNAMNENGETPLAMAQRKKFDLILTALRS